MIVRLDERQDDQPTASGTRRRADRDTGDDAVLLMKGNIKEHALFGAAEHVGCRVTLCSHGVCPSMSQFGV